MVAAQMQMVNNNPNKERKFPIQVMMTPSMRSKVDTLAKSQDRSFSYCVVQILENYFSETGEENDVKSTNTGEYYE